MHIKFIFTFSFYRKNKNFDIKNNNKKDIDDDITIYGKKMKVNV
jgi:hypothetical protein